MSDPDATRDPRDRTEDPAARVERVLDEVATEGGYPANSDDLAAQYRATEFDLVNETETFADAFDRLADEYDEFADPDAAREALTAQLRRDERFDEAFTNEM